jgi:hypothetical protein
MSYAETASVSRPPLTTTQYNGQQIITINKELIDANKFLQHFNKLFPLHRVVTTSQDSFMHALDTWLLEHKEERELLVTEIQALTSRCNFLKKTAHTNKTTGISGAVDEDTYQPHQYSQLMVSNLTPNDILDPEHLNVVIADVAITLRTQQLIISPEECRALAFSQPVMIANGHSAVLINITPRVLHPATYIVQASVKSRSNPTGGAHKNYYVITFLNNKDLHNIVPFAAIRGNTLEDSTFTSSQLLYTIRQLLPLPDTDVEAFIQPVYHSCVIEGEKGNHTTLFYTVLFYQQRENRGYNLKAVHEDCTLINNKPVNITINNE